jgi:hypothetical protein
MLTDGCLKAIAGLLRAQHRKGMQGLTALDLGGCSRLTENELNKVCVGVGVGVGVGVVVGVYTTASIPGSRRLFGTIRK